MNDKYSKNIQNKHISLNNEADSKSAHIKSPEIYTKDETIISAPPMYNVLLLNDDFTPMDFVVLLLKEVFHKEGSDAIRIMLNTHHDGQGNCGTYTREVAETKMVQVVDLARKYKYPLRCIIDKAS